LTRRRPTPQPAPAPAPTFTQDQLRERRRHWLRVIYRDDFDLTAEVAAIVTPLASEVSRLPRPVALCAAIADVSDGVAEVVHVAAGLVAESRASDKSTRRLATDLAVRPRQPEITAEHTVSGSWSTLLVEYAATIGDDLAALLGRALPPGADGLRGEPSASERVEAALRILDSAALTLSRLIPKAAQHQALPSIEEINLANNAHRDAQRHRAALAKIGVTP
jgi:hypothetical protein